MQAKNDLLDDKWDRTNNYDHAGRLSFNQFGMGLGSNNLTMKRVYEQAIGYDAFSMMTSRWGVHWSNTIGFSETYTNGRITNSPNLLYDASGNIIDNSVGNTNPHEFERTGFDASGRRTVSHSSVKGRMGNRLNMVTETKNETVFDGDGHPVIQKTGFQRYHAITGTPPAANWQPDADKYQIWSSVLEASLMTITLYPTQTYIETKVYAGGAVIAEKIRSIQNNQTGDGLGWKTSDPVTGTEASLTPNGDSITEESEPLGQRIDFQDTGELPEPPVNELPKRSADDAQWQCEGNEGFWGGFSAMPFHCQKKILQDLDKPLKNLYPEQESNPIYINLLIKNNRIALPHSDTRSAYTSRVMMSRAMSSTTKKTGTEGGSSGGCTFDKDGNPTCSVDALSIDFSDTGLEDADDKGGSHDNKGVSNDLADFLKFYQGVKEVRNALKSSLCRQFLQGKLNNSNNNIYGNRDPRNVFSAYLSQGLILTGESYATRGGMIKFSSASIGAATTTGYSSGVNLSGLKVTASQITINSKGFFFTLKDGDGNDVRNAEGFRGLSDAQVRGAVIIHELAHAFNAILPDRDNLEQNRINSKRVQLYCFSPLAKIFEDSNEPIEIK